MPRKRPITDQPVTMAYPLQGIDLSTGYGQQRPGTTPVGQNVRSFDAGTLRMRGGSRSGLTPFFGTGSTAQVNGFALIQNLNTIVTVSEAATFTGVLFANVALKINYSEKDSPPARDAPQVIVDRQWFAGTSPTYSCVSGVCVPADGGGTGQGTASLMLSTDGTNVTATGTFVSAGFPGPYFYSGGGQVESGMETNVNFLPPISAPLTIVWVVIAGSFIAELDLVISTF